MQNHMNEPASTLKPAMVMAALMMALHLPTLFMWATVYFNIAEMWVRDHIGGKGVLRLLTVVEGIEISSNRGD